MSSQGHVLSTTSLTLCHVCYKHFKLRQDGTLVRHGGKVKGSKCPGSLKHPPSNRKQRRSLNVVNANISKTSEDSGVLDTAVDMGGKSSLAEIFFEKSSGCRLIDHGGSFQKEPQEIETTELICAMTGFINLLLGGVCPPELVDFKHIMSMMTEIGKHDALVLLTQAAFIPRLSYFLRTSSGPSQETSDEFNNELRMGFQTIFNVF
ncbi:hypothetical protein HELRODRAFT_174486 [Helobdella robusta]|uniref:Uncharacterized protein n=1 Tax=Helobdella robusta TaxID=6412 RepID=T1F863_HELRO|nr:hypothetical protein HELRODRAFT_174486 [Helobdella robusta]ESO01530.1 hypothetical protein HELRODRAFT_174486 [Helobdella robusta]